MLSIDSSRRQWLSFARKDVFAGLKGSRRREPAVSTPPANLIKANVRTFPARFSWPPSYLWTIKSMFCAARDRQYCRKRFQASLSPFGSPICYQRCLKSTIRAIRKPDFGSKHFRRRKRKETLRHDIGLWHILIKGFIFCLLHHGDVTC